MALSTLDWTIVMVFFLTTLAVGLWVSKQTGKNTAEYFLSGRSMPWWLLGMSMVATTFSTDTPNLVTDLVRQNGVAGNWVWWAFLLTGMLTVFVYARLWRKSGVNTDIEFYELRYSGPAARFLRGFRAIYLGLVFNVLAMSGVSLAAIKIGEIMLGLSPLTTIGLAGLVTLVFSAIGGFRGVIYTDFLLFFVAMIGAIGAAVVSVGHPEVGGLTKLFSHPAIQDKISILPDFSNRELLTTVFIIPIAVQWWSAWYPGAEPGGGGYIAQRMLAAKNENHAIGATFLFNVLHYALRPWPWILVALSSLIVFPDVASIHEAFPNVSESKLGHDLAYPAMLTFLPHGLLGLVVASLIAAYMSTISTHLNWGASYLVNDFYRRFVNPQATEQKLVMVGRLTTVVIMVLGAVMALFLTNATQLFNIIIMFGAGTGLIFILRWFWWRINAWSEISAMLVSGLISLLFTFAPILPADFPGYLQFPLVVLLTTITWLAVTFLTPAEKTETLQKFYREIQPGGPGWAKVRDEAKSQGISLEKPGTAWMVPSGILAMLAGVTFVYACLFATGEWIFGNTGAASGLTVLAAVSGWILSRLWLKIGKQLI